MPALKGTKLRKRKGMGKRRLILLGCLLIGSLTSTAFGDDVFAPVNIVYTNSGKAIRCRIGWLEGRKMVCQKSNGTVSFPLQTINLEKTFPKFKKEDGETVLLVHPGKVYRDEHIAVSNIRMIRETPKARSHNGSKARGTHFALLCDVINSGAPCEVSVSLAAKDLRGRMLQPIRMVSSSRVGYEETLTLREQLNMPRYQLESQIVAVTVDKVQRSNIGKMPKKIAPRKKMNPEKQREEKIRALKEHFLQ
jgi:hypothetical protein